MNQRLTLGLICDDFNETQEKVDEKSVRVSDSLNGMFQRQGQGRLTMLIGQYSETLLKLPRRTLENLMSSLVDSLTLTSLMNSPLNSGAVKKRLHEFIVLPGFSSMSRLDSGPSSGKNLSCSWLLQKISLRVGGIVGSKSDSLSEKRERKASSITIHHGMLKAFNSTPELFRLI